MRVTAEIPTFVDGIAENQEPIADIPRALKICLDKSQWHYRPILVHLIMDEHQVEAGFYHQLPSNAGHSPSYRLVSEPSGPWPQPMMTWLPHRNLRHDLRFESKREELQKKINSLLDTWSLELPWRVASFVSLAFRIASMEFHWEIGILIIYIHTKTHLYTTHI